jgi:zinc and cadmium transporter
MTFFALLILFIAVFAAGMLFFVFKKTDPLYLKLSLAFTGAYLFAISMIDLIPGVFETKGVNVGYYILLGFFIQLMLEYFSRGIEHGHIHVHNHTKENHFPLAMMAGLCIHSFLEGMPLSATFKNSNNNTLLAGILLHHLPVAFALVSMLSLSGLSRVIVILNLGIFAMMAPAGAIFSNILGHTESYNLALYFNNIMAVVIGIFLHISTTILFESSNDHRFNLYKLAVIILGGSAAVIF